MPFATWIAKGQIVADADRPRVMGIVNATPDSFSDGGLAFDPEQAVARVHELIAQGADILDIGGESSRPGADVVPLDEELRRVLPLIERLKDSIGVPISIDTAKPEVAKRAIAAGAVIVNDISGVRDQEMAELIAATDAGVVVMHMAGTPQTMQIDPRYDDVVSEVLSYLEERVQALEKLGVRRERIAIDPGIGFGKTNEHNLTLLRELPRFATLGCAVLIGISRKGVLKSWTGRSLHERRTASVVASLVAATDGAGILRVHDVGPMVDAIKVWGAIKGWTRP
jgi:dihydropteroate synthase